MLSVDLAPGLSFYVRVFSYIGTYVTRKLFLKSLHYKYLLYCTVGITVLCLHSTVQ